MTILNYLNAYLQKYKEKKMRKYMEEMPDIGPDTKQVMSVGAVALEHL